MRLLLMMIKFASTLLIFQLIVTTSVAQTNGEIIGTARSLASKKEYAEGLVIVRRALEKSPSDHDLLLMEVRLLAYKGDYNDANNKLKDVIEKWDNDLEALQVGSDIAYWSEDYNDLVQWCDRILVIDSDNYEAHYRKALASFEKNDLNEAKISVTSSLESNPNYDRAIILRERIDEASLKNAISLSYRYSYFDKIFSSWHNASASYTRNTSTGPLTARINYGYQFDVSGTQFETDWYPRISSKSYAYLNAGYSGDLIFPEIRLGAEYFHVLPQAFEVSAGAKFLKYDVSDVTIFTGSLSKYHKNYWLSYRPTLTKIENEQSWTHTFQARKYFDDRNHYIGAFFGAGNAPVQFVTLAEIKRLSSTRVGAEYQRKLSLNYLLKWQGEYQYEEYLENEHRNRFTVEVVLVRRF